MKRRTAVRFAFLLFAAVLANAEQIAPDRYLNDVRYLASPALKGRGTGTPELEKAARYIAKQFRQAGIKPPPGQDYFQPFPVTTSARLGSRNRFEYSVRNSSKALKLQGDFVPFNFSESGRREGPVVFAGYGITAPEYHYDDYAGLDVKDKIVLLLRHEPQEGDEKSVFAGKMLTEHAQFWSKAVNARQHGARAVVLINDIGNHKGQPDELERFGRAAGPVNTGIPFVQVRAAIAGDWFKEAGASIEDVEASIDKDLKPRSFALPATVSVAIETDLKREVKTVRNVAAYLPGQTDEYVVIGAHYDHLGMGDHSSMSPAEAGKKVHPGADDNASGTAGVLELARWFASQPKPKRGILFLAFAGEELGLLGSRYFVDHPELPLKNAVAMINLDMIGRLRDGKLYIGGAGSGTTLKPLLEQYVSNHNLKPDFSGSSGYGSSDHTSFATRGVPVLFFFSGLHPDYHKPSDTWDKIDAPAAAELLKLVAEVATRLAVSPERPQYVKMAEPPKAMGGGQGYGAWFGSIPDFGDVPRGAKFAGITEGSPAAKAGLKAGDILIEFDGKPIQNLYDFTYALRARKPGDQVKVKVLRGSETVEAEVALEKRR